MTKEMNNSLFEIIFFIYYYLNIYKIDLQVNKIITIIIIIILIQLK